MRHARADYNERIQDSAGLIPDDEPVFLLRAQDKFAPSLVRAWGHAASLSMDVDPALIRAAHRQADDMERWQATHTFKTPDAPEGSLEVSA